MLYVDEGAPSLTDGYGCRGHVSSYVGKTERLLRSDSVSSPALQGPDVRASVGPGERQLAGSGPEERTRPQAAGDDGLLQGARACHSRLSSRVDVATAGFRREALGLYSDLP